MKRTALIAAAATLALAGCGAAGRQDTIHSMQAVVDPPAQAACVVDQMRAQGVAYDAILRIYRSGGSTDTEAEAGLHAQLICHTGHSEPTFEVTR